VVFVSILGYGLDLTQQEKKKKKKKKKNNKNNKRKGEGKKNSYRRWRKE
jgi:hypothetical protein